LREELKVALSSHDQAVALMTEQHERDVPKASLLVDRRKMISPIEKKSIITEEPNKYPGTEVCLSSTTLKTRVFFIVLL
jgi:hypothetical protein